MIAAALLQIPLMRITAPVRELANIALNVGKGQFDVNPTLKGFGELHVLTSAFSSMATGLVERDKRVAMLMREQADKARLESELAIARRIQENLLPNKDLPKEAGLLVAAEYISAAECAGDWYHFAYNPSLRETIVVIADVCGHGAGSSMFTAIIAGLFEEYRGRVHAPFDLEGFALKTNAVINQLGREQWHATMLLVRYVADSGVMDILLAGHPRPFIKLSDEKQKLPPIATSGALGMSVVFTPSVQQVPFPKGSTLLAYTDGLTEATNSKKVMFGRKRVRDSVFEGKGEPRVALPRLIDGWRGFLGEATPEDDVCVILMRAA